MKVQILHVPECPGTEVLDRRLTPLLADRPDIQVVWQVVTTEDESRRLGMTGSPTILADGADLFGRPGEQPSLSCRLYPDGHGHTGPAPTTAQLREALSSLAPRPAG